MRTCHTPATTIPKPMKSWAPPWAVHSELGCGYLEAVYRAALKCEFRRRAIAFEHEVSLPIHYTGELLPFNYRVDFKCGPVLIEAKALDAFAPAHLSQII